MPQRITPRVDKLANPEHPLAHRVLLAELSGEFPTKKALMDGLGISKDNLARIRNSDLYRQRLAQEKAKELETVRKTRVDALTKASNVLREAAPDAAERVVELARGAKTQRQQSKDAWGILEATGVVQKGGSVGGAQVNVIGDKAFETFIEALKEVKAQNA